MKIGMVGLGRMGANMARRLVDTGYAVSVLYDRDPERAIALAAELGTSATTVLREVTAASDVIVTVVSDDAAMDEIFSEIPPRTRCCTARKDRSS